MEEWTRKKFLEIERLGAQWALEKMNRKIRFGVLHQSWGKDHPDIADWPGIVGLHTSWRQFRNGLWYIVSEEEGRALQAANVKGVISPWSDVGYHLGIEAAEGDVVLKIGRSMSRRGAHCPEANMNRDSVGICLVGNYDLHEPGIRHWTLALLVCAKLARVFGIGNKDFLGHREGQAMGGVPADVRKSCPGTRFDMQKFRRDLGKMAAA